MKAIILAAGLGTRLKPFTDKHPKALALVNKKSLLQRNIAYLQQHNIYDVIVNVHHFAAEIIETIEANRAWGSNITISDETDAVLETGGGLQKAAWYLQDEDVFVLMNVDVLTNLPLHAMIQHHKTHQPLATLATTSRETSRYFLFDDQNNLCGWRNTKTGEEKIVRPSEALLQKAFSGVHVISNNIFSNIHRSGKFSMVDVYLDAAKTHNIQSFDHSSYRFIDVGKPESIAEAEQIFL